MIFFRLRQYGDENWTEGVLEGSLEEFAGEALLACLSGNESLHVQRKDEGEEWEDV